MSQSIETLMYIVCLIKTLIVILYKMYVACFVKTLIVVLSKMHVACFVKTLIDLNLNVCCMFC